jgi:hypothetical protein
VYGPDKISSSANSYSPGWISSAAFAQRKPPLLCFPALARASICQRAGEGSDGNNSHTFRMMEKVQERQPTENLVKELEHTGSIEAIFLLRMRGACFAILA